MRLPTRAAPCFGPGPDKPTTPFSCSLSHYDPSSRPPHKGRETDHAFNNAAARENSLWARCHASSEPARRVRVSSPIHSRPQPQPSSAHDHAAFKNNISSLNQQQKGPQSTSNFEIRSPQSPAHRAVEKNTSRSRGHRNTTATPSGFRLTIHSSSL